MNNKKKCSGDLPATIFFSIVGFVASWLLGIIPLPLVGVFLALLVQLLLGCALGRILMPLLTDKMGVMLVTLGGFLLGFNHGYYAEEHFGDRTIIALVVAGFLFFVGFVIGDYWSKREERNSWRED